MTDEKGTPSMTETLPDRSPLTETQARALTDQIGAAMDHTWSLLAEAHDRRAWAALGYSSFKDYVEIEFAVSRRNAYRLLARAKVVAELEAAASVPRASLTGISQRAADDVKPVLADVVERVREAVKGRPKAKRPAIVAEVVAEHRPAPAPPGFGDPDPADDPAPIGQPRTQADYRRLGALILDTPAETLARCWSLDMIKAVNRRVVETHRVAAPPPVQQPRRGSTVTPMFKGGKS